MLENPIASDNAGVNGAMVKIPGGVGDKGSKFFFHDATLVRIGDGRADAGRHL
jgi:hypothetical protein